MTQIWLLLVLTNLEFQPIAAYSTLEACNKQRVRITSIRLDLITGRYPIAICIPSEEPTS